MRKSRLLYISMSRSEKIWGWLYLAFSLIALPSLLSLLNTKLATPLDEGTLKIVQIAKQCGYDNQSYFNRLFKNAYGMTPKQYREKK